MPLVESVQFDPLQQRLGCPVPFGVQASPGAHCPRESQRQPWLPATHVEVTPTVPKLPELLLEVLPPLELLEPMPELLELREPPELLGPPELLELLEPLELLELLVAPELLEFPECRDLPALPDPLDELLELLTFPEAPSLRELPTLRELPEPLEPPDPTEPSGVLALGLPPSSPVLQSGEYVC